ncbi:MAG: methyl-accepting chemotaxis protein, partial [Lachnospiraceae bacterium]|nr:methyl-accepting chemotaxis protein [Lachnospiraceae bacterium]
FLAVLLLVGNGCLGLVCFNRSKTSLLEQIQSNVMNLSQCAAASVSGDVLQSISVGDEESKEYQMIVEQLSVFRDNAEIEYIYTLRENKEGSIEFVVDSDLEEPADIGEECEATVAMEQTFRNHLTTVDEEPITDEWGEHISAYSPIFNDNQMIGAIGIDISATWITEQTLQLRNLIVICCIGTYVASLLLLQVLIIKFKRSIRKLNGKVEELASGSGDLTKTVDIYSGDELEVIAGNMNEFIAQIRSLVKDVAKSIDVIRSNGEELNSTVNENACIMQNMTSEIREISDNMEKSSVSSKEMSVNLAESVEEIASFAREVNDIRQEVHKANENAKKTSGVVNVNKKNALDSIHKLQRRMRKTSEEARQIEQIRQIAEEIGHISSQTRMLSLNAQIEASRAGAMGAGFAVVATEVGHLSNEIDRAIAEINQINAKVLAAVGALTEVSEEMIEFVSEDVVKDYDAFSSLGEEYEKTTETIRNQMADIGEQSFRISKEMSEINESIQEIASIVVLTSESANKLAASTNRISESMENLNHSSQKNTLHTKELNERVNKYNY